MVTITHRPAKVKRANILTNIKNAQCKRYHDNCKRIRGKQGDVDEDLGSFWSHRNDRGTQ